MPPDRPRSGETCDDPHHRDPVLIYKGQNNLDTTEAGANYGGNTPRPTPLSGDMALAWFPRTRWHPIQRSL